MTGHRSGDAEVSDSPPAAGVEWKVLGPLAARRSGEPLDLGTRHQRAVLATLLSRAGEKVSLASIIEALWVQKPPRTAVNIVHKHVGALRRVVAPELPRRAQGRWLLSDAGGYRLALETDDLDLMRFRVLVARASGVDEAAGRFQLLEAALALWRGPVAEDVADLLRADPVLDAINREQADAALLVAEDALALQRADRILPALRLAAQLHPTDELVHASLMRCLASAGQRAAALETFENLRALLADELGVSPGPVLGQAHLDVLRDNVTPAVRGRMPVPKQLPIAPGVFVGRDHEVRGLAEVLRGGNGAPALCLITGTAGVGKTTAAVHVAHLVADHFPDGQLYVDLRGFDVAGAALPAHDVLGRLLVALEIPQERIPVSVDARAALYRSAAAERRILTVLDNARDSAQVRPLLTGSGSGRTLVTSRQQLRGLTEGSTFVVSLDLFTQGEADLFLRGRLTDERVDAEPQAVQDLVELSGCLPLSLSLLAARAAHSPALPLADLVASVRSSHSSLDPFVDRAEPERGARSVMSWSYDSLGTQAARLFTMTAVYPGASITAEQAALLAGVSTYDARALLDELVEATMVVQRSGGRFWRHDLLRQYSAEKLETVDPAARGDAEKRLHEFMTDHALGAAAAFNPDRLRLADISIPDIPDDCVLPGRDEAISWFDAEYEAVLAIVARPTLAEQDGTPGWLLAWAIANYLDGRGQWQESLGAQVAGLAAAERLADPSAQVVMLRNAARARAQLGSFDAAVRDIRRALETLAAQPDASPQLRSQTHRQLSWVYEQLADLPAALGEARLALDAHPAHSRDPARAFALNAVGYYEAQLGEYDEALAHCSAAMDLLTGSEHYLGLGDTASSLGLINSQLGRFRPALHAQRQALELYASYGTRYAEADICIDIGHTLRGAGRAQSALTMLERGLRILEELDHDRAKEVVAELAELRAREAQR